MRNFIIDILGFLSLAIGTLGIYIMSQSAGISYVATTEGCLTLCIFIVLIITGFGILSRKNWARLTLTFLFLFITIGGIYTIYYKLNVFPKTYPCCYTNDSIACENFAYMICHGKEVVIQNYASVIIPLLLIFYLTRSKVKEQFLNK